MSLTMRNETNTIVVICILLCILSPIILHACNKVGIYLLLITNILVHGYVIEILPVLVPTVIKTQIHAFIIRSVNGIFGDYYHLTYTLIIKYVCMHNTFADDNTSGSSSLYFVNMLQLI